MCSLHGFITHAQVKHDLRAFGIYRALPVYGEPDYASGPPTSAEEYLRRVRRVYWRDFWHAANVCWRHGL